MTIGFAAMVCTCLAVAASPRSLLAPAFLLLGISVGVPMSAVTLFIGREFPERCAPLLTFLNFSWSIGALAAPSLPRAFLCIIRTALRTSSSPSPLPSLLSRARSFSETDLNPRGLFPTLAATQRSTSSLFSPSLRSFRSALKTPSPHGCLPTPFACPPPDSSWPLPQPPSTGRDFFLLAASRLCSCCAPRLCVSSALPLRSDSCLRCFSNSRLP